MADNTIAPPFGANPGAPEQPIQARVVAQYIKDLSFENPNIERLLGGPGDNPNLKIEVNVAPVPSRTSCSRARSTSRPRRSMPAARSTIWK